MNPGTGRLPALSVLFLVLWFNWPKSKRQVSNASFIFFIQVMLNFETFLLASKEKRHVFNSKGKGLNARENVWGDIYSTYAVGAHYVYLWRGS